MNNPKPGVALLFLRLRVKRVVTCVLIPVVATWIGAGAATAQASSARVTVHGVAYDSLHRVPLRDAFVTIAGSGRTTTSDARGQFHFDSVAPGTYTFGMQHDALDSIGVSGASARAVVTDGRDTVRISVPSFATLWRAGCGSSAPPKDSGFVFGTVRGGVGERPLAGATVEVSWVDVGFDKKAGVTQRRWHLEARSDATGGFSLCGVPANTGARLRAMKDSVGTGLVDVLAREDMRVQRRDFLLSATADSNVRGVIAGGLTTDGGQPLAGGRVVMEGMPEVRSGDDGRFIIRDVPTGTRQVDVLAIGMTPASVVVDVLARDTTRIAVELRKVVTLAKVNVTATTVRQRFVMDYEERRVMGFGHFRDSTEVSRHNTLQSVFQEMPSISAPSAGKVLLPATGRPGKCEANIWIDRRKSDSRDLAEIQPDEVAALEVYPRALTTPPEFLVRNAKTPLCGSVVVWTKRLFP